MIVVHVRHKCTADAAPAIFFKYFKHSDAAVGVHSDEAGKFSVNLGTEHQPVFNRCSYFFLGFKLIVRGNLGKIVRCQFPNRKRRFRLVPLHGVAAELLAGFFNRKTFSFAANCLKSSLPVNNANLHFGNLAKGKPSGFNGCSPKHVSSA